MSSIAIYHTKGKCVHSFVTNKLLVVFICIYIYIYIYILRWRQGYRAVLYSFRYSEWAAVVLNVRYSHTVRVRNFYLYCSKWRYTATIQLQGCVVYIYINGLAQHCSNSSALAIELLQSCTKPSKYKSKTQLSCCAHAPQAIRYWTINSFGRNQIYYPPTHGPRII